MSPQELYELRNLEQKALREREYKLSSCQGKPKFETRSEAVRAASHAMKKIGNAYHCGVCKGWHVGSNENGKRKRKAIRRLYRRYRDQ